MKKNNCEKLRYMYMSMPLDELTEFVAILTHLGLGFSVLRLLVKLVSTDHYDIACTICNI